MVQPQKQPCSQAKGIQLIKALHNEPQQPVMTKVPFHQIQSKRKERNHKYFKLVNF
jgi:hypothetical protein